MMIEPDGGPRSVTFPVALPLVAMAAVSLLSAFLLAPVAAAAYRGEPAELSATVRSGLWVMGLASPLVALAKGAALAAVAWAVLVLGGAQPRFRGLLGALVAGEVILAVQALWMAGLLRLRGLGGIHSPADLSIPTGLDVIFSDPSTPLGAMAVSVTPFHLAWLLFLGWAFLRLGAGSRTLAAVAAVACWLPAPLLQMVVAL